MNSGRSLIGQEIDQTAQKTKGGLGYLSIGHTHTHTEPPSQGSIWSDPKDKSDIYLAIHGPSAKFAGLVLAMAVALPFRDSIGPT